MRGQLLITFDDVDGLAGGEYMDIFVNNVIQKRIYISPYKLYSCPLYVGDVVRFDLTNVPSIVTSYLDLIRKDYTTDDNDGNLGIVETTIAEDISFTTYTFTATTVNSAYDFEYIMSSSSIVECYDIGSGYIRTIGGNQSVRDIKVRNGLIYTVGNFNQYNGVPQSGMTVTNLDGSLYSGFTNLGLGPGFNPAVEPLSDGKIYISTRNYGGVNVNGICRLNPNGTRDTTFSGLTSSSTSEFWDIEVQSDGKIIIGGGFTSINGVSRQRICRLNTDGSLDTSFGGVSGFTGSLGTGTEIYDMDIQTDGKILCIGNFDKYSGVTRYNICRLNTDGTLDNTFTSPFVNYQLYNLVIEQLNDGKILIGGNFQLVSGGTEYNVLKLNTDGTVDNTFTPTTGYRIVRDFEQQSDGKILIATAGAIDTDQYLFRINLDGSIDNTFNIKTLNDSNFATSETIALNEDINIYYCGGGFETVDGISYNKFISGFINNGDLNMCS